MDGRCFHLREAGTLQNCRYIAKTIAYLEDISVAIWCAPEKRKEACRQASIGKLGSTWQGRLLVGKVLLVARTVSSETSTCSGV